jgi:hypothetical protein
MTSFPPQAGRRCHDTVNSLHSTIYFSGHLESALSGLGVTDPMGGYLAGRAAALGPVGPGIVTAAFYGFKYDLVARHIPEVWRLVSPETAINLRVRAADTTLRRYLDEETIRSTEMAEAALLALHACEGCTRPGRVLYSAHADLPVPPVPHLALWHAATLLREHRGDCHITALAAAELDGLESLVSHSASSSGMPKDIVMSKRGWTEDDWNAAEDRLRDRGLMNIEGGLSPRGVRLRAEIEEETDRLDRAPYEQLGAAGVERLTWLSLEFATAAAVAGAFPAELLGVFVKN